MLFNAKALKPEEHTGAVVVSFDARWIDLIRKRKIKGILRKRIPTTLGAQWLYAYVNSPVSAIVARAVIENTTSVSMPLAIRMSNDLGLSPNEIKNYFSRAQCVGMYEIKAFELAVTPLTLERIRRDLVFYPPQSFFFMSKLGKEFIDEEAHFKRPAKATRAK